MTLSSSTKDLGAALAVCARFVNRDSNTTLQATSGILIEAPEKGGDAILSACDLALSVQITMKADVSRAGACCVPGLLFVSLATALPESDSVSLKQNANSIALDCDDIHTDLQLLPADQFPVYSEENPDVVYTCNREAFRAALQRVLPFVGTDDTRPILCGLNLDPKDDQLWVVATDGNRLAYNQVPVRDVTGSAPFPVTIPTRAATELLRILKADPDGDMQILCTNNTASSHIGTYRMQSRLIEGKYPSYSRVIPPSHCHVLGVPKSALNAALKRVRIMAERDVGCADRIVVQSLPEENLVVVSSNTDAGNYREKITLWNSEGEGLMFACRGSFVADALAGFGPEAATVKLATDGPLAAIVLTAEQQPEYLALVMPTQIA